MKTIFATGKILLMAIFFTSSIALSAQSLSEEKGASEQYRINIVRDNNGQKEVIDRTFTSKAEMDAFMKDNNISMPDEKTTWAKKSEGKKEKKIVISEKEDSEAENTELSITYSNFTAEERAKLIQQLLETKNCKVEVRHTAEITSYNSGESTAALQPVTPAGVNNVSIVNDLKLYPNPNKGQFHIAFSTDKPSDVKLRITDMNGKEVYNDVIKSNNGPFNKDIYIRPAVSEGTYILEAESNGQKITTQVVVQ